MGKMMHQQNSNQNNQKRFSKQRCGNLNCLVFPYIKSVAPDALRIENKFFFAYYTELQNEKN